MKKRKYVLAALGAAFLLAGCGLADRGEEFAPDQSSIYVNRSGQLSSASVESYDKDYYSQEELTAFVQERVNAFNSSRAGGAEEGEAPVAITSCTLEEGRATLILSYGQPENLVEFAAESEDTENQITAVSVKTVEEAVKNGELSEGSFIKAKDGTAAAGEDVAKQGKMTVVALEGQTVLKTEGSLQYYTEGVEMLDDHTVRTPKEKSFVVFK